MNAPFLVPSLLLGGEIVQGDGALLLGTMAAASVDMVYTDPPFGNGKIWRGRSGSFDDRWSAGAVSERGWDAISAHNLGGAALLRLVARTEHDEAYLGFIAGLLVAAHRVLRKTGTIWLHFDDIKGAQIRIAADVVFGPAEALGTIVWKRTSAHSNSSRCYGRVHDTIAVYGRSRAARWRLWRIADGVHGDPARNGVHVDDMIVDERLTATSKERVGYPTQKPVSLLARFIRLATLPGNLVVDPTCGSGTAIVAAAQLGRRGLGIDVSADAVAVARSRLAIAAGEFR